MINQALSAIKYRLCSSMSQRFYWTMMGRFQAAPAVSSQYPKLEDSLKSGAALVEMLETLQAIHENSRTLHIGCGIGRIELHLHKRVRLCYGIDISPSMIKKARAYVRADNVRFICTDALDSLPSNSLDLVFSIFVFQHLPRYKTQRYIQESLDKLCVGGKLVFQILVDDTGSMPEPSKNHPYGLRYYKREELRRLLSASGFSDVRFFDFPTASPDSGSTGDLLVSASRLDSNDSSTRSD